MNRLTIIGTVVMLTASTAFGQTLTPNKNEKNKWGYVDESGKVVVKYDYNDAEPFVGGQARVRKGSKWGEIGLNGKEIVKIQYSAMSPWSEKGYCKVAKGGSEKDGVLTGAKYGIINRDGTEIIKAEYDEIADFDNGVALLRKGNKYGYADEDYRMVIPVIYDNIGRPNSEGYIWVNKGGKPDAKGLISSGTFGIFNTKGGLVVPLKYTAIFVFIRPESRDNSGGYTRETLLATKNGLLTGGLQLDKMQKGNARVSDVGMADLDNPQMTADKLRKNLDRLPESYCEYFLVNKSGSIGITDNKGHEVLVPGTVTRVWNPEEGICFVQKNHFGDNVKNNYFDLANGKMLIPNYVEMRLNKFGKEDKEKIREGTNPGMANWFSSFHNGVARYKVNNKWAIVGRKGIMIDNLDHAEPFHGRVSVIKRGDDYALVDNTGKMVSEFEYKHLLTPNEGLIGAQDKNGRAGFLDLDGNVAIPFEYDALKIFTKGWACVKKDGKWGYIDKNNKAMVPFVWKNLTFNHAENPSRIWVGKDDDLFWIYDVNTKKVVGTRGYTDIDKFDDNGYAAVATSEGEYGVIDINGETVIPFVFDGFDIARIALAEMELNNNGPWTAANAFRFKLSLDNSRNKFKLTDKIPEKMWDF